MCGKVANDQRGFSLLEVLVVVTLLGLIGLIALPRLGEMTLVDPLSGSAARIVGLIGRVRSTAMESGKAQVLFLDSGNRRLWFEEEDSGAKRDQGPKSMVELPERVRLRAVRVAGGRQIAGDGPVRLWVSSQGLLRPFFLELSDGSGRIARLTVHPLYPKVDILILDPDGSPREPRPQPDWQRHT